MRRTAARYVLITAIVLAGLSSAVFAQSLSVIVETTPSADIHRIVTALGGTLLDSMGGNLYLVSVSSLPTVYPAGVKNIETGSLQLSPRLGWCCVYCWPNTPANFYRNQPAMQKINLPSVSQLATGRSIVIADINARGGRGPSSLDRTSNCWSSFSRRQMHDRIGTGPVGRWLPGSG